MNAPTTFRRAAAAWIVLAVLGAGSASADVTFNVDTVVDLADDNTNDGICHTSAGSCSLRAAITQANHWSNPEDAIINVPAGLYLLSITGTGGNEEAWGGLKLTRALISNQRIVINGESAVNTIIDGNQLESVFTIAPNRSATIARVTIRGGSASYGGGIFNAGDLILLSSIVEHNTAQSGGGIFSTGAQTYQGALVVNASTIRSNVADSGGGGIFTLSTSNSPSRILESTISGNHAYSGGGIYSNEPGLIVVNSTLSGNTADTDGGGIYNTRGVFMYNSSIVDNDADHDRDENGGIGGGVNTASGQRFVAVNSLIARNTLFDSPIYDDCNGTLEVYGRNFFYDVIGCTFSGNGTSARGFVTLNSIGPLQDNGGPTATHALLVGSEAINATTAQGCVDETGARLSIDQRDGVRGTGTGCDVGAYEYGATLLGLDRIFANGFDLIP